jgi:hypothetical protein
LELGSITVGAINLKRGNNMSGAFNPLLVAKEKSRYRGNSALRGQEGRFQRNNRRMVILIFPSKSLANELGQILSCLPNGTVVSGTHYSSEKSQYGLILSHWSFDPIEHGAIITECRAIVGTNGVQFEVLDVDTDYFEIAKWQYIDTRSAIRKLFDYFFN